MSEHGPVENLDFQEKEKDESVNRIEMFSFAENGRKGKWLKLEKGESVVEGALYEPIESNGKMIIFVPGMPGDSVSWFENNDLSEVLRDGYKVFVIRHSGILVSEDNNGLVNNATRHNLPGHIGKEKAEVSDWLGEPAIVLESFSNEDVTLISHSLGGLAVGNSIIDLSNYNQLDNLSRWINLAGVTYTLQDFEEKTKKSWEWYVDNKLAAKCSFNDNSKIVDDIGAAVKRLNDELPKALLPETFRMVSINPERDEYVPPESGINLQRKMSTGLAVLDKTVSDDYRSELELRGEMVHDLPHLLPQTLMRLLKLEINKNPHTVVFANPETKSK